MFHKAASFSRRGAPEALSKNHSAETRVRYGHAALLKGARPLNTTASLPVYPFNEKKQKREIPTSRMCPFPPPQMVFNCPLFMFLLGFEPWLELEA